MTLESIAGAAGAWLWGTYGQALADQALGAAKDKWAQFNWAKAAEIYRHRVIDLYGTTRILGQAKPASLAGIFTDAYLLDKPTALRRFNLEQLRALADQPDSRPSPGQRRSALSLALTEKRLFILGKPGAGKTTFLKYVALQAATGQIDRIPIFVSLKEWADSGLELMPFLVRQFDICAFPEAQPFIEYLLAAGQAIVLFDGLDEVNVEGQQRARIIADVTDFSRKYLPSACLITCRIAASDYTFEPFTYVEMADFDDAQVAAFVGKWFQANPVKGQKFLEELAQPAQRGLRDLARLPLLLTLLCLAFDETMSFPQRQVELYEEALDALLKKWDSVRNIKRDEIYRKLSLGRKRQMLTRLAAETFEQGEIFFRQADLVKRISLYLQKLPPTDFDEDIDGEAVLKAIEAQHGLLVERAHQIYSFSHRTFQEYFTARYFAESGAESKLELLMLHLTNDGWREIFLLTASMLDNADTFFSLMRRAIDDLIRGEDKLMSVMRWAEQKAARDYTTLKSYQGRREALDPDLDRALDLDRDYDIPRPLPYDRNLALDLALALALDLARDHYVVYRGNDHLVLTRSSANSLSRSLDLSELAEALRGLTIPSTGTTTEEWQAFTGQLQAMMIRHRDIGHDWSLNKEQTERLRQYHRANELLLDCLELAYVSNRAAIEDSLWRPPRVEG